MAAKRRSADEATEFLRTLLIVQLGLAGIGQREIEAHGIGRKEIKRKRYVD